MVALISIDFSTDAKQHASGTIRKGLRRGLKNRNSAINMGRKIGENYLFLALTQGLGLERPDRTPHPSVCRVPPLLAPGYNSFDFSLYSLSLLLSVKRSEYSKTCSKRTPSIKRIRAWVPKFFSHTYYKSNLYSVEIHV